MTMFFTLLLVAVTSLVVTCLLAFGVSPQERERRARSEARPALQPEKFVVAPPQFFAAEVREIETRPQVPIEVLMSQLQRHVQLEQAAAETFVNVPSPEALRSRTSSPFVN